MRHPTAIQVAAIPHLVRRWDKLARSEVPARDVLIQDMTGSGKTLAFVLPILSTVDVYRDDCQALIVVPTRELAVQAATVAHRFGTIGGSKKRKQNPIRVQAVVGDSANPALLRALQDTRPHVVVATPELAAHLLLKGDHLHARSIQHFIFDEIDYLMRPPMRQSIVSLLQHITRLREADARNKLKLAKATAQASSSSSASTDSPADVASAAAAATIASYDADERTHSAANADADAGDGDAADTTNATSASAMGDDSAQQITGFESVLLPTSKLKPLQPRDSLFIPNRQIVFVSATITPEVRSLAADYLRDTLMINADDAQLSRRQRLEREENAKIPRLIRHFTLRYEPTLKDETLFQLISTLKPLKLPVRADKLQLPPVPSKVCNPPLTHQTTPNHRAVVQLSLSSLSLYLLFCSC